MTTPPDEQTDDISNAQLIDLIGEAVVWTDDPVERAEALVRIVRCALDAICWRIASQGQAAEDESARSVLAAAVEHLDRMRQLR